MHENLLILNVKTIGDLKYDSIQFLILFFRKVKNSKVTL